MNKTIEKDFQQMRIRMREELAVLIELYKQLEEADWRQDILSSYSKSNQLCADLKVRSCKLDEAWTIYGQTYLEEVLKNHTMEKIEKEREHSETYLNFVSTSLKKDLEQVEEEVLKKQQDYAVDVDMEVVAQALKDGEDCFSPETLAMM